MGSNNWSGNWTNNQTDSTSNYSSYGNMWGGWGNGFMFAPMNTWTWYYNMNNNFEMHGHNDGCDNNGDSHGDYEASSHSQYWNGTGGNGDDNNNGNHGCCGGNESD